MKKLIATAAFAALVIADFSALSVTTAEPAGAFVCARGPYRVGCAGPRGAVVGHRRYYRPYYRRPYYGGVRVYRRW